MLKKEFSFIKGTIEAAKDLEATLSRSQRVVGDQGPNDLKSSPVDF